LVRGTAGKGEIAWDPGGDSFDASALEHVDGVVHLAAANIAAGRWTAAHKERIRESRIHGTRVLCGMLAKLRSPPKVLVSASAIGFYGDRGDELLNEDSAPGQGFLADLASQWESVTEAASAAGIRVVLMRFGIVLSPAGGALASMLGPFRFGVGGRLGSGRQFWSWIALSDAVGGILHALGTDSLHGPVNAVAPNPVTNAQFTRTLGRVLRRPTILPAPAFVLRLALGEMAEELLLSSARVEPQRLRASGFQFGYGFLEDALRHMLQSFA
jgi:uncharacterized protein (TIGR01777 family)